MKDDSEIPSLFPELTDEALTESSDNLDRYVLLISQILDRLVAEGNPQGLN